MKQAASHAQHYDLQSCSKYLQGTKLKACLCFAFLVFNTETRSGKQQETNIYSLIVKILAMRRNKIKADFLCKIHFNLAQICVFQARQFCLSLLTLYSLLIPVFLGENYPLGSEQNIQLHGEKMLASLSSNRSLACAYLSVQDNLNQKKPSIRLVMDTTVLS